jgi:glycosyltransferase involved in cell wall biosynthesis
MSYQRFVSGRTIAIASRLAGSSIVFTGCSGHIAAMGEPYGGRWYAIPNFVNTHFYSWTSSVPPDAPLVFLSRVEPLKGADIAIEIAKSANRQLILAGNHSLEGHEGRYWLERIAPEIGRNGIEYIGPVDDAAKAALLARAAALIVPVQWDEPFGIVFAEALACGTPVISCPRGALPEIVREGVDGFLIDSIDEGKNAVEKLHTIDRAECRKRAETHFSSGVVVSRYEDVYVDLLRRTHARSV